MPKRIIIIVLLVVGIASTVYFMRSDEAPQSEPAEKVAPQITSPVDALNWGLETQGEPGRESLDSLRERLLGMPAAEALAEIEGFLATGGDRNTGLEFTIGAGGRIEGWPTLRVFLLDLLLEIDPEGAARISRGILEVESAADEWAIALRNVAKGESAGENRDYLRKKAEELITTAKWQAQPSVGYLNAFDVLVYVGATESAPLLSNLIQQKDRRDLAHAGFLTLDRLVQNQTVEMLTRIQADRALQESRPEMTAQQFARADLRDEAQQALVKSWLLDPDRTPTELKNFVGTYPNNNMMISHNLLTTDDQVSGADLTAHDREVLGIIRSWRNDPEFSALSEYLEISDRRLSGFVESRDDSSQ